MAFKGRFFKGTPESAALMQPYVAPAPVCNSGILLGINMLTRKLEYFDPWALKMQGTITSTMFLVLGDKGYGKSSLMKSLILRLSGMQAASVNSQPELMRVRVNDRKPEDGEPEYKPVSDYLESLVVPLNRQAGINPFDPAMNMTAFDIVETAVNLCEEISGQALGGFEAFAIQVGVHKMLTQVPEQASPGLLEYLMRGLDGRDIAAYFTASSTGIEAEYAKAMSERGETISPDANVIKRPHNIPEAEFKRAAGLISSYLGRLLRGDYGGIFGGDISLRDSLSQPMVTFDWSGVNDRSRTLLQSLLWKWQTVALNRNDLSLIPHINVGDEEHEAMTNLMYVRFQAAYVKKARAFHTADFRATQYQRDIGLAGHEGSEIRSLAQGILLGMGARIIFRQPKDDEVLNDLAQLGISDQDLELLPRLPVGCCAIKYPDLPIRWVQHILTPTELELVKSNAAARRMTQRISVQADPVVQQRQRRLLQLAELENNQSALPPSESEPELWPETTDTAPLQRQS